jgi:hypothetical protein
MRRLIMTPLVPILTFGGLFCTYSIKSAYNREAIIGNHASAKGAGPLAMQLFHVIRVSFQSYLYANPPWTSFIGV